MIGYNWATATLTAINFGKGGADGKKNAIDDF